MKKALLTIMFLAFTVNAFALSIVKLGPEYFPTNDSSRALANGYIYVGEPDLDPETPANQKTLSIQQESGVIVSVSQPIRTSSGGVPIYEGSPVTLLVDGNYSLLIQNSYGDQEYYVPSLDGGPVSGNLSDYGCNIATMVSTVGAIVDTHIIIDCSPDPLSLNITIPANITIEWRRGFPLGGAYTLTVEGSIIAGDYKVFDYDITVLGLSVSFPEWFGAVADGVTDDILALEKAFAGGDSVHLGGQYAIGSNLQINEIIPISGDGSLIFTGSGEDAVTIGASGANTSTKGAVYLRVERSTEDATDQYTGIHLINVFSSELHLDSRNFYRGIKLHGDDGAMAYNTIYLTRIQNPVEGIELHADGTSGYVNQNTFIGGRIGNAISSADDLHGIVFTQDSGSLINGNTFLNPSFELNQMGTGYSSCYHGRTNGSEENIAQNNKLLGGRSEATEFILSGSGISYNSFDFTRSGVAETVADDILNGDIGLISNKFILSNRLIYSDSPLKIASFSRLDVVQNTPGSFPFTTSPAIGAWFDGGDDTFYSSRAAALSFGIASASDKIIGVLFDLSNVGHDYHRRISLRALLLATGGRFSVACFNSSGAKLTDSESCSFTYSSLNGIYKSGSDLTIESGEIDVLFGDNVAYAFVGISDGSADANLSQLDYFVLSGSNIKIVTDKTTYETIGSVSSLYISGDKSQGSTIKPDTAVGDQAGMYCRHLDATTGESSGWLFDGTLWNSINTVP